MKMKSVYKRYRELLDELIAFKSISTDKRFASEITKTVEWYKDLFDSAGFNVEIFEEYGNPIIISRYTVDEKGETFLIYGHYDVQPASTKDGWYGDAFSITEKDDRLYARGSVDNKGQSLVHIVSVLELIAKKQLKFNVVFLIEGNEETGSPKMQDFIKDQSEVLSCNGAIISDGEIVGDTPIIDAGFRGGINCTLTYQSSTTDLHSGVYGSVAPNSAHELARFITNLFDTSNLITIPGFYDDVDDITAEEKKNNEEVPFDEKEFMRIAGVKQLLLEKGMDVYTQVGLRPAIEVSGFQSGYTSEGYRNGIPASAFAKINFRLVNSQSPEKISKLFSDYVEKHTPDYIDSKLEVDDLYEGIKLDVSNEKILRAKSLLEKIHGKSCYFKFSGGGLPIVTLLTNTLNIPCVMVSFGNEDCAMHAVNENFSIDLIKKGLEFSTEYLGKD